MRGARARGARRHPAERLAERDRPLPSREAPLATAADRARSGREAPALAGRYERVFVAYADCGTGGELDKVLELHGVERLPGAHCYGFLTGNDAWEELHDAEPATFYLTDFLARHFDALVIRGLGLDRHPGASGRLLRELPAAPLSGADRRRRPAGARTCSRRAPRARVRGAPHRLRRPRSVADPLRGGDARCLS